MMEDYIHNDMDMFADAPDTDTPPFEFDPQDYSSGERNIIKDFSPVEEDTSIEFYKNLWDRTFRKAREIQTSADNPVYEEVMLSQLLTSMGIRGLTVEKMQSYLTRLESSKKQVAPRDIKEFLKKNQSDRKWLVAGLLPMATTVLLFAQGGLGKTLLLYDIVRSVGSGRRWNGFRTIQTKILIIQMDEPEIDTSERLKIANFDDEIEEGTVFIENDWQFTQLDQLEEWINQHRPGLVVIDSLTAANLDAVAGENDASYARSLARLTKLSGEYECTFLVLHHESKGGTARGTSAIVNTPSEIWRLRRGQKNEGLTSKQRYLDIEKSRSGVFGRYLLELDPSDNSWRYVRDGEEDPLDVRILRFFEDNPDKRFLDIDISNRLNAEKKEVHNELNRLRRKGLIDVEQRSFTSGDTTKERSYFYYPLDAELDRILEVKKKMLSCATTEDVIECMKTTSKEDRYKVHRDYMTSAQRKKITHLTKSIPAEVLESIAEQKPEIDNIVQMHQELPAVSGGEGYAQEPLF